MKILFTGGGTGGHFYPIIAVAEGIHDIVREEKLLEPALYFAAPSPHNRDMLIANGIEFVPTAAGKMRRYFSILNFFDWFKTGWGIIRSVFRIFFLYPDVVFAKGGYASFPTLLAAKLFGIPIVIHESDAVPGRVNQWAGKFAQKIAISFHEAEKHFPKNKVVYTGNPVRKEIMRPSAEGVREFLKLEESIPTILILGGSQGAVPLNDTILSALPKLIETYQVIHQCGEENVEDAIGRARIVLGNSPHKERYKPFGFLNDVALKMSAAIATVVVSRAGSTLFEIALWGKPAILVPFPEASEDHQTKNAFAYAHAGGAVVIEQRNLTPNLLTAEIDRIVGNPSIAAAMAAGAKAAAQPEAAKKVARLILDIGLSHES